MNTHKILMLTECCFALLAGATERVWTGNAGNGRLATPGNWEPVGTIGDGDDLSIPAPSSVSLENDLTVTIGTLTLAPSAGADLSLRGSSLHYSGTLSLQDVENATNTLSLNLYGSTLTKSGGGILNISGDNRGITGDITINKGCVKLGSTTALGQGNNVYVYANGGKESSFTFLRSGVYSNSYFFAIPSFFYSFNGSGGILVTNVGSLSISAPGNECFVNKRIHFQGPITLTGTSSSSFFNFKGSDGCRFQGGFPIVVTPGQFGQSQGMCYMENPVTGKFRFSNGTVQFYRENLFSNAVFYVNDQGGSWRYTSLSLNGYDQIFKRFITDYHDFAVNYKTVFTSGTHAKIEIQSGSWSTNDCFYLNDAISFLWSGTETARLSRNPCTMTGTLSVANGTLCIMPSAAFPMVSNLQIGEGARLCVETIRVNPAASLVIAEGGKLEVTNGVTMTVQTAKYADHFIPAGLYTASSFDWMEGGGSLLVSLDNVLTPSDRLYVWTGAGADDSLNTPENWEGGTAPAWSDGEVPRVMFGIGTDHARAYGNVFLQSLLFETNAPFHLAAGDSTAKINLFGSLSIKNPERIPLTNTVDVPLLLRSETISISVETNALLKLDGSLSSSESASPIVVSGEGITLLGGNCTELKSGINIGGTSQKGRLYVASDLAFGRESAGLTLNAAGTKKTPSLCLIGDRTIDVPVSILKSPQFITQGDEAQTIVCHAPWTFPAKLGDFWTRNTDTWYFHGGWNVNGDFSFRPYGGSLWFTNQPIVLTSDSEFVIDNYNTEATVYLGATNNVWNKLTLGLARVVCMATNTLPPVTKFTMGYWRTGGELDLNGFDQTISGLNDSYATPINGSTLYQQNGSPVTSAKPAVLTIEGNGYEKPRGTGYRFTGNVSLHYTAEKPFVLTNFVSTTTGSLIISRGRVAFAGKAGWHGSTNITVRGTGTLAVENSTAGTAFGSVSNGYPVKLSLEDSATVDLPAGDIETVKTLSVNGRPLRSGTYGSPTSPAEFPLSSFTGNGVLRVLHSDIKGSVLTLR